MKSKNYLILFILLLICSSYSFAQMESRSWISGGITYGGLSGIGIEDNVFDLNAGFKFEFGSRFKKKFGITWYGFSTYTTNNVVKESTVEAEIGCHIFEGRYFLGTKKLQPYLSFGLGFGTIRFDGVEGKDAYAIVPFGGGVQYIFEKMLIEAYFKPYIATEPQLGQNFGYEGGILVGYVFWK